MTSLESDSVSGKGFAYSADNWDARCASELLSYKIAQMTRISSKERETKIFWVEELSHGGTLDFISRMYIIFLLKKNI